jgi:hypothetical protein
MNQFNMQIVCVVWGSDYISIFKNFCLTSLEFKKYLNDFHWIIYTRVEDVPNLVDLSFEIRLIDESLFNNLNTPIVIQSTVLAKHQKQSTSKFIWYLPPDTVWSKGAIEKIKIDLAQDPGAIYMYYCRVDAQEALKALSAVGALHDANQLYEINKNHIHKIHKSHNINAQYSTKWPEYYWVGDDSLQIAKVVASVPLIINMECKLDSNNQIIEYQKAKIIMYGGTDTIFCLSLTPEQKDCDWYENYSHLLPSKVANWCLTYGYARPSNPLEDIFIKWAGTGNVEIPQHYINTLEKFKLDKDHLLKSRANDFGVRVKPVYSIEREVIEHVYLEKINPIQFNLDNKLYRGLSLTAQYTFFVKLKNGKLIYGIEWFSLIRHLIAMGFFYYDLIRLNLVRIIRLPFRILKKLSVALIKYILKVTLPAPSSDNSKLEIWKQNLKNHVWKLHVKLTRNMKYDV